MFQEREERFGLAAAERHFSGEPSKNAWRRAGKRPAGGIVDIDLPAFELHRNAAREPAVRGDEGGDLAWSLGSLAEEDRDGQRLLAFVGGLQNSERGNRFAFLFERRRLVAPAFRGAGRTHRFGDEAITGLQAAWRLCQRIDGIADDSQALQQQLQAELRMARAGGLVLADTDGIPSLGIEILIEAGEDDRAVLEPRDRREQRRGRFH